MSEAPGPDVSSEIIEVELRNPVVAALLAWAWPGGGHFYQGRYAKSMLFMTCILGTYFFGLAMAEGHVVYSSFTRQDLRLQYVCQLGVGTPSLLALVQRHRVIIQDREPILGGLMAPPHPVDLERNDQLAEWHRAYHRYFDLGTLYTMVAGLLNVLVIFDAYSGPMGASADDRKQQSARRETRRQRDEPSRPAETAADVGSTS